MNNISITEKDLYRYVFYPNILSIEKSNYIAQNIDQFKDELSLFNNFKESVEVDVSDEILNKIHNKINRYSEQKEIILNIISPNPDQEYSPSAADNSMDKSKELIKTFLDKTNNFLGKIITTTDHLKVYVFSKISAKQLIFEITLFPSNSVHTISSEDLPLIITPIQEIKQIKLKFI